MSTPAPLLADLAAALDRPELPLTPSTISVLTATPTPDALAALLAGLTSRANGWLCLTDRVLECAGGAWRQVAPDPGPHEAPDAAACARALAGEFALDGASSLHLRRVGSTLASFRYAEDQATPQPGEAVQMLNAPVLFKEEEFVSTERTPDQKPRRLAYRTFYVQRESTGAPPVATWQPLLSRFVGWEDPR